MSQNYEPALEPAKGLIQREISLQHYKLTRYLPSDDLAHIVENYWTASWNLTGAEPYLHGNLPHPCQNIVINTDSWSGIFGVQTGKLVYKFQGKGRIFGVRFWPGAFQAFYKKPVKELSDRWISIADVFDADDRQLERELQTAPELTYMAELIEQLLRKKAPVLDAKSVQARGIVEYIESNREVVSVSRLAELLDQTPRALQRLFDTYVGVSPKWVIERYRMLEAVSALDEDAHISIVELANRLGYYDQAHFTRAFTKLVGCAPSRYNFK